MRAVPACPRVVCRWQLVCSGYAQTTCTRLAASGVPYCPGRAACHPGQRRRLLGLPVSAGDLWACLLEINAWRRARQDRPLVSYQELCRELARAGPGTFGELDTEGARSVLRRYSDAWFATAKRRNEGDRTARFPRRRRALMPLREPQRLHAHRQAAAYPGRARSPAAAGDWRIGHLISVLEDKAEVAGIGLQLVDERGTSSTCLACRSRIPKPAGRMLACPACQFTGHRDLSAAANIAARFGGGITPVIPAGVTHRRAGAHLPGVTPSRRDRAAAPIAASPAGPLARTGPHPPALGWPGSRSPPGEEPAIHPSNCRQVH